MIFLPILKNKVGMGENPRQQEKGGNQPLNPPSMTPGGQW